MDKALPGQHAACHADDLGPLIKAICRPIEGVRSPATCVEEASVSVPWLDKSEEFVRTPMSSVHSGQTGTPKSAVTPRMLDLSSGQRYVEHPALLRLSIRAQSNRLRSAWNFNDLRLA